MFMWAMQNFFVYGTLLCSEIIEKLTAKSFQTTPAILPGYRRYCVSGTDYPAAVKNEISEITGLVIAITDKRSTDIISFYEGEEYKKKKVKVFVDGRMEDAFTFVWAKENSLLENRNWDLQEFRKNNLKYYLDIVIPETLKEFEK